MGDYFVSFCQHFEINDPAALWYFASKKYHLSKSHLKNNGTLDRTSLHIATLLFICWSGSGTCAVNWTIFAEIFRSKINHFLFKANFLCFLEQKSKEKFFNCRLHLKKIQLRIFILCSWEWIWVKTELNCCTVAKRVKVIKIYELAIFFQNLPFKSWFKK